MKIEIGSIWEKKKTILKDERFIVKILYVGETAVFFKHNTKNIEGSMECEYFKNKFKPYTSFKWQNVEMIDLGDGDRITYHQYWEDKNFELLHNYKRYFNEVVKKVDLNDFYTIGCLNEIVHHSSMTEFQKGSMIFLTKEHILG